MTELAGVAPSSYPAPPQFAARSRLAAMGRAVERWLEAERDQLPLWLPVMLGLGVASWFLAADERAWKACALLFAAVGSAGLALGRGDRAWRTVAIGGFAAAIGLGLVWWRAERVAAPVLARPVLATFSGRVVRVEPLAARELVRLTLEDVGPGDNARGPIALPARLRVNLQQADSPQELAEGATVKLRARLMPPPAAAVPGAYDYARVAWFDGIGAIGRGFAPVRCPAGAVQARGCEDD